MLDTKCIAAYSNVRRQCQLNVSMTLNDCVVPVVDEVKDLGVIVESE